MCTKPRMRSIFFEKLNITEIFNVPYCPQFNGIESYFSQLKATYKKLVLKCVINDAPYDTIDLIKQSIESISNENTPKPQNPFSFMKVRLIIGDFSY